MDRFEKHAEYIMKRGDKILAEKEIRNKKIRRVSFSLSGVIVTIIICFFAWRSDPPSAFPDSGDIMPEIIETTAVTVVQVTSETTAVHTTSNSASAAAVKTTSSAIHTSVSTVTVSESSRAAEQTGSVSTAVHTETEAARSTDVRTTETAVTTAEPVPDMVYEVYWGYNEGNGQEEPNGEPLPLQNLAMKCKSFCASGEKLTVDVAMADASLRSVSYDTAGDYKYEVYVCDPTDYKGIEDKNFIVNGEHRRYKKEYSKGDVKNFDINGKLDDYDSYHHETTEIDFSDYKVGSSGCIKFAFKIEFSEDPNHTMYTTANQYMYFYVGEKGTFISNKGIEKDQNGAFSDKKGNCSNHGHHDRRVFDQNGD